MTHVACQLVPPGFAASFVDANTDDCSQHVHATKLTRRSGSVSRMHDDTNS